ncbi:MAG: hypothetical protein DRG83_17765, partial [Deltaproteobacteria bacterium]
VRQISLKGKKRKLKQVTHPGIDSDFYTIVETLIELGYERQPWESMKEWIDKIGSSPLLENENGDLQQIVRRHYRYRFDPMGIKSGEKEKLTELVDNWHRNRKHD